ncbi:MAG: hypothetical protein Q9170_000471 [Blastenia crenularia]
MDGQGSSVDKSICWFGNKSERGCWPFSSRNYIARGSSKPVIRNLEPGIICLGLSEKLRWLDVLNHFGGTPGKPGTAAGGPAYGLDIILKTHFTDIGRFGAWLSYASADGKTAAASPQSLQNQMIEDDVEVIVMSNRSCDEDYTDGFAGDHKLFMMEFSMPATGKTGFSGDQPGIWLLNAQIPLTSQYGTNPECSCWTSGCGEFDLLEILDAGNFRCKSTLHIVLAKNKGIKK